MIVCAMNVSGFFRMCYDLIKIKSDDAMISRDRVQMTIQDVNEVITQLFNEIKPFV